MLAQVPTKTPAGPATVTEMTAVGGRYLLDRRIGRGATGTVWRGHRRLDGRPVAIKVLRAEHAIDPVMVTRFARERTAVRTLSHEHLVPVEDLVVEDDTLAVVMQLVNGHDLRRVMNDGELDPGTAVTVLTQVACALAYIHECGVLHRDVKPENVVVTREGGKVWARLTDFGLAWAADAAEKTQDAHVYGTPAYVAPEVLTDQPHSPAVDVYSFGIMVYELLSGRRPFTGTHPLSLIWAHLHDEPERPEDMTDDVWSLVSSCLAKCPQDRPTAAELARRLGELDHAGSTGAPRSQLRAA